MRNTDGSRSRPAMFQIDPPTEAIIERAQGEIVPGRRASRSEVLRHFAAHWIAGRATPPCPSLNGHRIVQRHEGVAAPVAETPPQRLERLRSSAGLTQPALATELGLSRSQYQRAIAAGKLPAGADAWMRQQEGGGR